MHWRLLLVVYLAVLFVTVMLVLASESHGILFVMLLAAGIPVYFVASRTILHGQDPSLHPMIEAVPETAIDASSRPFPDCLGAEAAAEVAQAAVAGTPRLRQLR